MMELRVEHLRKSYGGVPVLRDVSFTAGEGVTCVMGPSGEGKTTLLRLLLGLERPDGGTISGLEGRPMAAVFQEDRLLTNRTALENLRFVLGPAFRETECRALLAELGLPEADGRPVSEYSGGMRRRVALARALAVPSDLLVLDEPFTGLDRETRDRCAAAIRRRCAGKVVLLATHDGTDPADFGAPVVRLNG